jgi:hypothetical protein
LNNFIWQRDLRCACRIRSGTVNVAKKSEILVLLSAVCLSSVTAHAFAFGSNRQPAGCHEHRQKSPIQLPTSYQCCLYGHDSAIVTAFSLLQSDLQQSPAASDSELPLQQALVPIVESLRVSSGDPPDVLALRI